jgi:hypothetical protein
MAFKGKSASDFKSWKTKALPAVLKTLGDSPEKVKLNPQLLAEWKHDGLRKQKWLIDVSKHISATLLVNYPKKLKAKGKTPAIMCCHGHGPFGKDPVMGNDSTPELKAR